MFCFDVIIIVLPVSFISRCNLNLSSKKCNLVEASNSCSNLSLCNLSPGVIYPPSPGWQQDVSSSPAAHHSCPRHRHRHCCRHHRHCCCHRRHQIHDLPHSYPRHNHSKTVLVIAILWLRAWSAGPFLIIRRKSWFKIQKIICFILIDFLIIIL